jgi:alpha-tubulin suppressor-like RCC1 family protein
MAGVKISALSSSSSFTDTDVIPVVSGGITKKVTGAVVKAAIGVPAAGTVGTTQLANGSVTTPKFATGAVDASALGALSVETAKINDSAVTTAKIADANVTLGKLESSVQGTLSRAGQSRSGTTIPTTGSVKGVVVLSGGSGYSSGVTVSIAAPPSGTTATATATVSSGVVTAITIVTEGSGYTDQNPAVTITAIGAGSGATAVAYAMVQPLIEDDGLHSANAYNQFWAIASNDNIIHAGSNLNYSLGNGPNNNDASNPVNLPIVGYDGVKQKPIRIYSSGATTYVLCADGSLWSAGYNAQGQLGRGFNGDTPTNYTSNSTVFEKITFSGGGVVKKFATNQGVNAAQNIFSATCLALVQTSSGETLYGWGNNSYGQLGNGGTSNSNTPQVLSCSDGASTVTDIGVAGRIDAAVCLVLFSSGRVKASGYNGQAQLSRGNSATQTSFAFVEVSSGTPLTNIVELGGMGSSTCSVFFRTSTGYIYVAGFNSNGELGTGNTTPTSTYMFQAVGADWDTGTSKAMFLSGSYSAGHGFAFKSNGDLYRWGYNGFGQLGATDIATRSTPIILAGFTSSNVSKILPLASEQSGLAASTAILKTDGSIYCAGYNASGQLGLGYQASPNIFVPARIDKSIVKSIYFIGRFSTTYYLGVHTTDGSFYTCGDNTGGQGLRGYDNAARTATFVQGRL